MLCSHTSQSFKQDLLAKSAFQNLAQWLLQVGVWLTHHTSTKKAIFEKRHDCIYDYIFSHYEWSTQIYRCDYSG